MVCTNCGVVTESHVFEERVEWYDADRRVTAPSKDDVILGSSSTTLSSKKAQRYAPPDATKSTRLGFKDIERLAGHMRIDPEHHIVTTAKEMYRDFQTRRKIREDARVVHAACALYFGCKAHERANDRHPRTLREMEQVCGHDMHDTVRAFKEVLATMPYASLMLTGVDAGDLIGRKMDIITAIVQIDDATRHRIVRRARTIQTVVHALSAMEGRVPEGVCGAILHYACEVEGVPGVSKTIVADAVGVSGVTIGKALKELRETVDRPDVQTYFSTIAHIA